METKKFKEDHIKAFMEAGKKAHPKNVVSESSIDDQYLEISRQLVYPNKEREIVEVALSNWGEADDNDEGLTATVIDLESGCKVYLTWRIYFGLEVRDNTIDNFRSWAEEKSRLFDQAQELIKQFNPNNLCTGRNRLRVFRSRVDLKSDEQEVLPELMRYVCEKLKIAHGGRVSIHLKYVEIPISDRISKEKAKKLIHAVEDRIEKEGFAIAKLSASIEIQ